MTAVSVGHIELAGHPLLSRGKVRELYGVGDDEVLLVASDRISAYDVVLPTPIPDKGAVLTALTLWWFDQLADVVPGHLLTARSEDYPPELRAHAPELRARSMLCRRLDMVEVECVARGYLAGSGLADYRRDAAIAGHPLPPGLAEGSRLPEPIYTPSTKAPLGAHDETITRARAAARLGPELAAELERLTLAVYRRGADLATARGILLADTKLEFGHDRDCILRLGDEVLTPDSSRFWPADSWQPGRAQPSYDKQFVRDWLTAAGLAGTPAELPPHIVEQTRDRYVDAYERLTGSSFDSYLRDAS